MKPLFLLIALFTCFSSALAQEKIDSLLSKAESVQLPELPDSLKTTWNKVDSIRGDFNQKADSLQSEYKKSISSITAQTNKIQHKIDSLNNLKLPSNKLTRKLDSLRQRKEKIESDFNSKVDNLKSKTIGKLDKIEMTPEMQGPVGEFTSKINGFNVTNNDFVKIPALEVPGYSLPKIDGLGGLSSQTSKIPGLDNLPKIDSPLGNISDVTKQAEGLGSDVKNIAQGNLNDVKQIPESIEAQAGKIEGVEELQKQSGVVDGYKEQLKGLNDPDAMKQKGADMAKKEAINHFAGKEKQLKEAMDKMSKYKAKYSSVKSIKDLPKRPPNAMKGKPFRERFIPGVYLQWQVKNAWLLDVNPYGSYRVSGRFSPGLGWNQRFTYERKGNAPMSNTRIFGPRAFLDFKLGKGFIAHAEQEAMYTFVPTVAMPNTDAGEYQWVWSTMLGIKKTYKIYKNISGTVLIQYNFTNQYFKTPYLDRLNSRMGFEYNFKKRKKSAAKKS